MQPRYEYLDSIILVTHTPMTRSETKPPFTFKCLVIHYILQFTLANVFCYVLLHHDSWDIHRHKLYLFLVFRLDLILNNSYRGYSSIYKYIKHTNRLSAYFFRIYHLFFRLHYNILFNYNYTLVYFSVFLPYLY